MSARDLMVFWPLSPRKAILLSLAVATILVMAAFTAMAENKSDSSNSDSAESEATVTESDAARESARSCEKGADWDRREGRAERGRYGQRGHRGPPPWRLEGRGRYGSPSDRYRERGQYGPPPGRYHERITERQYGPPPGHRRPYQRRGGEEFGEYRDFPPSYDDRRGGQERQPRRGGGHRAFEEMDRDGDGSISQEEFDRFRNRRREYAPRRYPER